ncbi:TPA: phosphoethanolamine transferase [Photobacterium damselae]
MKNLLTHIKQPKTVGMVTFLLALYFAIVLNLPLWRTFEHIFQTLPAVKIGFIISLPIFLTAALNIIFNLFSWPYITKPFFSILIFFSALVCYAMYQYGAIFDYGMMENIFETNAGEATSYFSLTGVVWVTVLGVLPVILLLKTPIKPYSSALKFVLMKLVSILASLVIIGLVAFFYYKDYSSVGRNNHYLNRVINPAYVYALGKYVDKTYFTEPMKYQEIGTDAKQVVSKTHNGKPTLFVFVLGETARSMNYELNGYPRPTNQYTKKDGVISFKSVSSCGTATAVSVPCMFSAMNKSDYNREVAYNQDTFIDILHRAGISMLWKENDGGDKGAADRINKIVLDRSSDNPLCDGESCYDMALLNNFDKEVSDMKGNKFITLHIMGSHGPTYYKRYPKDHAFFKPDCQRADIENCTTQEIVNSYDNTILYTDYVIDQLIQKLKGYSKEYNTALFYISDHGESLGEDGLYLHGTPYALAPKYQTTVPMMIWMSKGFEQDRGINPSCLEKEAESGHFSQDNVFHSMLGVMDVQTKVYNPKLDIFKTCRSE